MKRVTTTKKPCKHHYFIHYKKGSYFEVDELIEDQYPKLVWGSGMMLDTGAFDIHLCCTSQQFRKIKGFLHRNVLSKSGFPIKFDYTRQTVAEYNRD